MFRFRRRTESSLLIEKLMEDERVETRWRTHGTGEVNPAGSQVGEPTDSTMIRSDSHIDEDPLPIPAILRAWQPLN